MIQMEMPSPLIVSLRLDDAYLAIVLRNRPNHNLTRGIEEILHQFPIGSHGILAEISGYEVNSLEFISYFGGFRGLLDQGRQLS